MNLHPTGIGPLDESLSGGVPAHASLLFRHPEALPAEPFVLHCLNSQLVGGGSALYCQVSPTPWQDDFARLGFDPSRIARQVQVLDLSRSEGAQLVESIQDAARRTSNAVAVLPPIPRLVDALGLTAAQEAVPRILEATAHAAYSLWTVSEGALTPGLLGLLDRMGAVVRLQGGSDDLRPSGHFSVERCSWAPPKTVTRYPFTVARPGGVLLHIPKVLVTGAHDAGKSEFIRTVADEFSTVEESGTTVALDHGRARRGGVLVELVGTPGQERFTPLIRQLAEGARGIILVVDATRPWTFLHAREILDQTWHPGLPLVVAANKHEAPGALDVDAVRRTLGLQDGVVLPCTVTRRDQAERALDALLQAIVHGGGHANVPTVPTSL